MFELAFNKLFKDIGKTNIDEFVCEKERRINYITLYLDERFEKGDKLE